MRTLTRSKAVAALAAGLVIVGGGTAYADNLVNNVTVGGNDTITAGSSTTISYKINATGGDGQPQCNASDGSPATVTLSVPAGVTASTNRLTFADCNAFQPVTFSATTPGSYPIAVTGIADSGPGSYNNQANFTLRVNAPPNTAPTLTLPADRTVEATGPGGAPVTYTATADDAQDGPLTPACSPQSGGTFPLGATTVNCSVTDSGGMSRSGSFNVTVVDTTAPGLELPADITAEATGPDGAAVGYTAGAADLVDGPVAVTCTPASGSTFALGATTVNCSAADSRGNSAGGSFGVTVRDTTPPDISLTGGPANGSEHYFGSVPAAPSCAASDAVSGDVSCTVTGHGTGVGSHTLTATAVDGAGNRAETKVSYRVLGWTLTGFYSPVDMNGVVNTAKGGSTVPVKFEMFAGSTELTSTTGLNFTASKVSCSSSAPTDDIEVTATGNTSLRYDTTAGQYVYNWKLPTGAGTCYRLTLTAADGSSVAALFRTR